MTEIDRDLFPKRIEVTSRQFVIAVGTVASVVLKEMYGLDLSDGLIKSYVEEKMESPEPEKVSLIMAANLVLRQEFGTILNEVAAETQKPEDIRRKTRRIIEEKYRKIDSDPERNFSYLDSVLISG
jgi:hypothetical protein